MPREIPGETATWDLRIRIRFAPGRLRREGLPKDTRYVTSRERKEETKTKGKEHTMFFSSKGSQRKGKEPTDFRTSDSYSEKNTLREERKNQKTLGPLSVSSPLDEWMGPRKPLCH